MDFIPLSSALYFMELGKEVMGELDIIFFECMCPSSALCYYLTTGSYADI